MNSHFGLMLVTVYFLISPIPILSGNKSFFVIWNVGQGQWLTHVEPAHCVHFDMGGERAPWRQIETLCKARQNRIVLSHLDWDHIRFLRRAPHHFAQLCLWVVPDLSGLHQRIIWLRTLPRCSLSTSPSEAKPVDINRAHRAQTNNDRSQVFLWNQQVLLPGDSSQKQESRWRQTLPRPQPTLRALILGHHGSRNSTGPLLLQKIPQGTLAVASARKQKYGHPHQETLQRLARKKMPTLITEKWGHIRLDYQN